jgi:hydroxymethyl cephem carbamoyltransferase
VIIMLILSFKPGHDGSVAAVGDGELLFALEAEKSSNLRFSPLTPEIVTSALGLLPAVPDVVCESGWIKGDFAFDPPAGAGYFGAGEDSCQLRSGQFAGRPVKLFSSSHERSHILCSFGLSPFPQGQKYYVLIWEGALGDFYLLHEDLRVEPLGRAMPEPGNKYSFPFYVAHSDRGLFFSNDWAGKVMALAAYGESAAPNADERAFIDFVLTHFEWGRVWRHDFEGSPFLGVGVESVAFKNLARKLSDAIFERFEAFARQHLRAGHPLLIGGGCGLNCEWNSRWRDSGLFADVFVPPCTNDTGSALGTAIDAQRALTGSAKIRWSVYSGEEFVIDVDLADRYVIRPLVPDDVAEQLAQGAVLGWVQGRYEMGPRALGHRSILAAPFEAEMRDRLNRIKQRAGYRPVAPVCPEEEVSQYFAWSGPSPYMLHFQRVTDARLRAVTHVDDSARVQTITREQVPTLVELLHAFARRTGAAVLCNTSLNFPGRGFINCLSDLARFQNEHGLDGFVVGDQLYLPRLPV